MEGRGGSAHERLHVGVVGRTGRVFGVLNRGRARRIGQKRVRVWLARAAETNSSKNIIFRERDAMRKGDDSKGDAHWLLCLLDIVRVMFTSRLYYY